MRVPRREHTLLLIAGLSVAVLLTRPPSSDRIIASAAANNFSENNHPPVSSRNEANLEALSQRLAALELTLQGYQSNLTRLEALEEKLNTLPKADARQTPYNDSALRLDISNLKLSMTRLESKVNSIQTTDYSICFYHFGDIFNNHDHNYDGESGSYSKTGSSNDRYRGCP